MGGPSWRTADDLQRSWDTKLALFEGLPQKAQPTACFHRVAFRVNAGDFMNFLQPLSDLRLMDHEGDPVTSDAVVDHHKASRSTFPIRMGTAWKSRRTSTKRRVRP